MEKFIKYSYCGFNCENCPIYYKNKIGNNKNLKNKIKINDKNNKIKSNNMNINNLENTNFKNKICYGCKNESEIKFHKDCNIALCAEKRGISFCGLCPDFPCAFYSNFTTEAIERIYKIKEEVLSGNIF